MEIINHILQNVRFAPASKNTIPFTAGNPDTIIIHYTASGSAESAIDSLASPDTKASAHLVVARDGTITQLVPFDIVAWHAGASHYGTRVGFNQYSIGIEIENAGLLEKRGNEYYAWFGRTYPAEVVTQAVHRNQQTPRYWHTYTEGQIQTVENICRSLIAEYAIKYILGHEEISPTRKVDPGPAFPLDKFRNRIFGGDRDQLTSEHAMQTDGTVNIDLLNIRSSGSTSADIVAKPLPKGQKVRIVATKEGWLQVTTEVTGWVSAKFIDS